MLHFVVEDAFDDLLTRWREHQRRRSLPDAHPGYLGESRIQLDKARDRVHRLRVVMYPNPVEAESVAASVFCDTLDAIVHLNWSHHSQGTRGEFTCLCGETVTVVNPSTCDPGESALQPADHH